MTITEILSLIHKERVELEVFEALSKWMIEDRSSWIDEAMESKSTITAIGKIAKKTQTRKTPLKQL